MSQQAVASPEEAPATEPAEPTPAIQLEGLSKSFGDVRAVTEAQDRVGTLATA